MCEERKLCLRLPECSMPFPPDSSALGSFSLANTAASDSEGIVFTTPELKFNIQLGYILPDIGGTIYVE